MNDKERAAVVELLDHLYRKYEDQYEKIIRQQKDEIIPVDFFEDLYEILYDFSYDESKLIVRVTMLLEQKAGAYAIKTRKTGIIKNSPT